MRTLTKTEKRQDAQNTILSCIQGAFYNEDLPKLDVLTINDIADIVGLV